MSGGPTSPPAGGPPPAIAVLEACRMAEKEQALFYRSLAADAEERGEVELAQRFHDLHADEQHHLSRLTARVVELGGSPSDVGRARTPHADLQGWEPDAKARETEEVGRYEDALSGELDETSRHLLAEILEVERQHAEELGGKWTLA